LIDKTERNISRKDCPERSFFIWSFKDKKMEASFEKYWKKLYNVKVWSDFVISF